jgi:hypothetical protein
MQRLERAAAAEVSNHLLQTTNADREKVRTVDSLKGRFYRVYQEKLGRYGWNSQFGNLAIEMDEVRSQLRMTSSGISFLIEMVRSASAEISSPENNPDRTLCLLPPAQALRTRI